MLQRKMGNHGIYRTHRNTRAVKIFELTDRVRGIPVVRG
jgi:hypothetical protein